MVRLNVVRMKLVSVERVLKIVLISRLSVYGIPCSLWACKIRGRDRGRSKRFTSCPECPVQLWHPPTSFSLSTGVLRPVRDVNHPPPPSAQAKC